MKRGKKVFKISLLLLLATFILGVFALQSMTYKPMPEAIRYAKEAKREADTSIFTAEKEKGVVILYGGGLVVNQSYAKLGAGLAEQGYTVYLLHSPLNLPILATNKAKEVIKYYGLKNVYIGGHSLGGVVASMNAELHEIKGLLLLAAYPPDNVNLSKSSLSVLSLTASEDKILNWSKYEEAKKRLPANTQYRTIPGGNHSGFGLYGQQRKDGSPSLSASTQQDEVIRQMVAFMEK
ncbi:alpha/beta hydrolase [Streptococcus sp. zg-86]|uniref:Alpha/beta hydrolase n=1 Tax=Streptococcus zhangguiae TaxID=2664091 RepID=A0A6I4RG72_9STRE|nr:MULTISPECIES: alpha/beta hydrolase [unclassified Streptococcus]MTB63875.1 alpha/beta hydrolase [Streptococcus sp. zg-86]MTB90186.1 alpha/beta hydrolase [Streptococcus sp. zg-36]MWV55857.1 alpha/beta hydrolase [Streptococcus sp. zg-70]QTH48658.1 alpha/beta hydrolase [Streptococcus sp. zg-86]